MHREIKVLLGDLKSGGISESSVSQNHADVEQNEGNGAQLFEKETKIVVTFAGEC